LRDAKWTIVDQELKEAIEHADSQRKDAAFHAANALESTIKIISDDKGWSSGRERGAANYIDNLVSQQNGRFSRSLGGRYAEGLLCPRAQSARPWRRQPTSACFDVPSNGMGHRERYGMDQKLGPPRERHRAPAVTSRLS
jgi:hypothetical protein